MDLLVPMRRKVTDVQALTVFLPHLADELVLFSGMCGPKSVLHGIPDESLTLVGPV